MSDCAECNKEFCSTERDSAEYLCNTSSGNKGCSTGDSVDLCSSDDTVTSAQP